VELRCGVDELCELWMQVVVMWGNFRAPRDSAFLSTEYKQEE
jgi:hypothetical protein